MWQTIDDTAERKEKEGKKEKKEKKEEKEREEKEREEKEREVKEENARTEGKGKDGETLLRTSATHNQRGNQRGEGEDGKDGKDKTGAGGGRADTAASLGHALGQATHAAGTSQINQFNLALTMKLDSNIRCENA